MSIFTAPCVCENVRLRIIRQEMEIELEKKKDIFTVCMKSMFETNIINNYTMMPIFHKIVYLNCVN